MPESLRVITFDDLRDALESLAIVRFSDEELADRGVRLTEHDTLRDGLGPSMYTLVELNGGQQYLLERLDLSPDDLWVVGTLTDDPEPLTATFLTALEIPESRVTWAASADFWSESRRGYNRDEWLVRRERLREQS